MSDRRAVWKATLVGGLLFASAASLLVALEARGRSAGRRADAGGPGSLAAPREVDGVPCREDVRLSASGKLASCVLDRETAFGAVRLPAGSRVYLDAEGSPKTVFLGADTRIDGHLCRDGHGHDYMTTFHPDGRLAFCNLREDEVIQGVPCSRSSFWIWVTHRGGAGTSFHVDGKLAECLLSADATLGGVTCAKGSRIRLDRDGRVQR